MVPTAETIADIGCDHGKVAVELIKNKQAKYVICTDISGQSLKKATKLVSGKNLEQSISLREGDGLGVLGDGEADVAVIAGMGGELIANILSAHENKVPEKLVLSCNTASGTLRQWLSNNGFHIVDEDLVFETRHFYPVILATKGNPEKMTDLELEFGPVLLRKRPKTLKFFVRRRIDKTAEVRAKIAKTNATNKQALLDDIDARLKVYGELERCL